MYSTNITKTPDDFSEQQILVPSNNIAVGQIYDKVSLSPISAPTNKMTVDDVYDKVSGIPISVPTNNMTVDDVYDKVSGIPVSAPTHNMTVDDVCDKVSGIPVSVPTNNMTVDDVYDKVSGIPVSASTHNMTVDDVYDKVSGPPIFASTHNMTVDDVYDKVSGPPIFASKNNMPVNDVNDKVSSPPIEFPFINFSDDKNYKKTSFPTILVNKTVSETWMFDDVSRNCSEIIPQNQTSETGSCATIDETPDMISGPYKQIGGINQAINDRPIETLTDDKSQSDVFSNPKISESFALENAISTDNSLLLIENSCDQKLVLDATFPTENNLVQQSNKLEENSEKRVSNSKISKLSSFKTLLDSKLIEKRRTSSNAEDEQVLHAKSKADRKLSSTSSITTISAKDDKSQDNHELDIIDKTHGILYLKKKKLFSRWRKYLFVLDGYQLTYYSSKLNDTKLTGCKGLVDLTRLSGVVQRDATSCFRTYYPIELERRSISPLFLGADSESEQQRWLSLLRKIVETRSAASMKVSKMSKSASVATSPDVVLSALPSATTTEKKKKRKTSLRESFSFRRSSKDKIRTNDDENETSTEGEYYKTKDRNSDMDAKDEEIKISANEIQNTVLIHPKKVLKPGIGIPLIIGDISSIRLKKRAEPVKEILTSPSKLNSEDDADKPDGTFGVQLKRIETRGKECIEDKATEELSHDYRSFLKSRKLSTTGVDSMLYKKYSTDTNKKEIIKRSPSPNLPISESLKSVLSKCTNEFNIIPDEQENISNRKTSMNIYAGNLINMENCTSSVSVIDLENGMLCPVNHAVSENIRYSDPPNELQSVERNNIQKSTKSLEIGDDNSITNYLETSGLNIGSLKVSEVESTDSNTNEIISQCHIKRELINAYKESPESSLIENHSTVCTVNDCNGKINFESNKDMDNSELQPSKLSNLTDIVLQPIITQEREDIITNKNELCKITIDDFDDSKKVTELPAIVIQDETFQPHSNKIFLDHESTISLSPQLPTRGIDCAKTTKSLDSIDILTRSELFPKQNVGKYSLDSLNELSAIPVSQTGYECDTKSQDVVEIIQQEKITEKQIFSYDELINKKSDNDNDDDIVNSNIFCNRIDRRKSAPYSFEPTKCIQSDSSTTSVDIESEYVSHYNYNHQISIDRSSSVESGEPLPRVSFMGTRLSWESSNSIDTVEMPSAESQMSIEKSTIPLHLNSKPRQDYHDNLACNEDDKVEKDCRSSETLQNYSTKIKKMPIRKRPDSMPSVNNRGSLILPEFIVLEEDSQEPIDLLPMSNNP